MKDIFHCKKPDCTYYGILNDEKIKWFVCPICKSKNCVPCTTIHKDKETCEQYRLKKSPNDLKTLQLIEVL